MTNSITKIMQAVDKQPTSFADYLQAYAAAVGELVNAYIASGSHPDMDRYLYSPLLEYSKNGGKRHRPLICFAACEAVGGNADLAIPAAAGIEHFHTAALIHDDIADDAKTRRGEPCLHLSEGLGLAINMGDNALMLVVGPVVRDERLESGLRLRLLRELLDMTQVTIEGQALDIGWSRDGRFDLTTEDYLCMATHKTAHYSGGTPLAIGALVGGASDDVVEGLRQFGLDTGLAFQIQDDLLNLVGDEDAIGKDFRNDITEGKRTLMVVHGLQNSAAADRERLIEILSSAETDPAVLDEAVRILEKAGSLDFARTYAQDLIEKAKADLVAVIPDSPSRQLLISMADFFVKRLK